MEIIHVSWAQINSVICIINMKWSKEFWLKFRFYSSFSFGNKKHSEVPISERRTTSTTFNHKLHRTSNFKEISSYRPFLRRILPQTRVLISYSEIFDLDSRYTPTRIEVIRFINSVFFSSKFKNFLQPRWKFNIFFSFLIKRCLLNLPD